MSALDADDSGWRRLALYILVMAVSVLAPGAIVLSLLILWLSRTQAFQIPTISKALEGSTSFGSLFLAGAVGLSFIVGYTARALGFRIIRSIETPPTTGGKRLPRALKSVSSRMAKKIFKTALQGDTCEGAQVSLKNGFGAAACQDALRLHPALGLILNPTQPSALLRHRDFDEAFVYAKLWLRRMAPPLNIDSVEVEVNILCASIVPIALSGPVIASVVDAPLYIRWPLAIASALLIIYLVIENALNLRKSERYEAFRNLVADCAMRLSAESFAAVGTSGTGSPGAQA